MSTAPTSPIDTLMNLDIEVPAPGRMDSDTLNLLISELAGQNAVLTGSTAMLRKTCEAQAAQIDGLKAAIRELQAERAPTNGVDTTVKARVPAVAGA